MVEEAAEAASLLVKLPRIIRNRTAKGRGSLHALEILLSCYFWKKLMKLISFVIVGLATNIAARAQSPIKAADAAKHLNEKATVCDSVYGGRWLENANGQPCLLNMGGSYPNNPFTFVIFGENRTKFNYKPEEFLINKQVCVAGEVKEFRGKPQIIVDDPKQVELKK